MVLTDERLSDALDARPLDAPAPPSACVCGAPLVGQTPGGTTPALYAATPTDAVLAALRHWPDSAPAPNYHDVWVVKPSGGAYKVAGRCQGRQVYPLKAETWVRAEPDDGERGTYWLRGRGR